MIPKISFYLKSPKAIQSSIYMGFRLNSKMFKYYIGETVYTDLFDVKEMKCFTSGELVKEAQKTNPNIKIELKNINNRIAMFSNDTELILSRLLKEFKYIEKSKLKEELDYIYHPEKLSDDVIKDQSFINYLEKFISKCESGKQYTEGERYSAGTIKTYKTFLGLMKEYNNKLLFDDLNMEFYNNFLVFSKAKGHSINYIGRNIKFIKVIMRNSYEKEYHKNLIFKNKSFKTLIANSYQVCLTQDEVDLLINYNLDSEPKYKLVRDVFYIACNLGLRFSDFSRIKKHHIKDKGTHLQLEMITTKTKVEVKIPLKEKVVEILAQYDFEIPKIYEQKMNKHIKEICEWVGIDEVVEYIADVGGERITVRKPKFELIKSHTARRTACTLMYLSEIPIIDIMKISGHTKQSTLLKYVIVTKEQTAQRLSKTSFFK